MKVLITGCAGYVGSVLTDMLLRAGHSVTGVDILRFGSAGLLTNIFQDNFQFHRADICDEKAMQALIKGQEAVIHLAAIVGDPASKREPELTRKVNLDATERLIKIALGEDVSRFIFFSTCSNYGLHESSEYATETSELNPVSLYAETKVAAEKLLLKYATGGFSGTVLRCATVYGFSPRMRFDLTVNHFTRDSFVDKKLVVYGEQFWRPYVHVHDMAAGALHVLDAEKSLVQGEVFNTGNTDENYQKRTIAEIIQKKIPETEIEYVQVDEDPRNYKVNFSKIKSVLNYGTKYTLAQGVDQVNELLKQNIIVDPRDPIFAN
jgi:nucleoside-diphosphate-sugar epimerase